MVETDVNGSGSPSEWRLRSFGILALLASIVMVVLGVAGDSLVWLLLGAVGLINVFAFDVRRWKRRTG